MFARAMGLFRERIGERVEQRRKAFPRLGLGIGSHAATRVEPTGPDRGSSVVSLSKRPDFTDKRFPRLPAHNARYQ